MTLRTCGALLALAVSVGLAGPAAAQQKPTIAIMPTQYFAADPDSARNITQGLIEQYTNQQYTVIPAEQAQSAFESLQLKPDKHYPDAMALKFGRVAKVDLVAYPRLLALGIPAANPDLKAEGLLAPAAVIHLRVMNVHTNKNIFFRQIAHEFVAEAPSTMISEFKLPQPVAVATAQEVTSMYFDAVAGSRQEMRSKPPRRRR